MSITWNGVSSDTIGVIVERIPNRYVPTRRFSPQQVAGRNGNILLVDKSFPNVEQEYEVYLSAEAQGLPSVARACAEWLMGPDGYCRLEDSYDTTVYREAFLMGGYDLENILNKFGRCTITFSCKPQKYLLTGDTPIEIPAGITTYTGDVVQFDGVTGASITSLSTTITPTQDLHGYDHPWPAGGGKNLLDPNATIYKRYLRDAGNGSYYWTYSADSASIAIKVEPETAYTLSRYLTSGGIYRCSTIRVASLPSENDTTDIQTYQNVRETTATAFGTTRTITTDSSATYVVIQFNGATVRDFVVNGQFEKGSSATDYAPYSNICPISGRTGLSVYRTGKNLFNKNATDLYAAHALNPSTGGTYSAGSYTVTGFIKCKAGEKYITSGTGGSNDVCFYDANKSRLSGASNFNTARTAPNNAEWLKFDYKTANADTVQLEQAASATAYESFGNTYAVDWSTQAGTVYHGTVDPVAGQLTVDWASVYLGTLTWKKGTEHKFYATTTGVVVYKPYTPQMLCDTYKFAGARSASPWYGDENELTCYYGGSGIVRELYINDPAYTDLTEFQTAMSGVQLVYELATPLTYQLTGQEIEVLVGENNVWTSSGPVSVTVEAPFVGTVTNPTPFEARPLLEVSGVGEITINGKSIQILEAVSDFQIDCETMEAEDNSKIYCMDFPELSGGENEIVGDGSITALTVTPRWWTL